MGAEGKVRIRIRHVPNSPGPPAPRPLPRLLPHSWGTKTPFPDFPVSLHLVTSYSYLIGEKIHSLLKATKQLEKLSSDKFPFKVAFSTSN